MKWHNESWVKLYIRRTAEWDDMSVMARGIGNELLKYAKNDGSLCRTKGREAAMAVAMVLRPNPDELEAVVSGAAELLEDGYLVVEDGMVWVKNYEDAQERRSPDAVRQQRHRDRNKPKTNEPDRDEGVTHDRDSRNGMSQGSELVDPRRDSRVSTDPPAQDAGPLFASTKPSAKPKAKKAVQPKSERPGWSDLIAQYSDAWKALHSSEGKPPAIEGADVSALARVYDSCGLDETIALLKRFVSDSDEHITRRGHMLRDLPSRLNAYRAKPATGRRGHARATAAYDATSDGTSDL